MTDDARVLDRIWPNGMPEEERAFLAGLPPLQRERLMERVRAIDAATRADADLTAIAGALPMGRTSFYELRRRWTVERSLKVISPWATRVRGSGFASQGRPSGSEKDGRGHDGHEGRSVPSLPTARRLARERARARANRPAVLRAEFGRGFVLDVSGVNLIARNERSSSWLVCAILVERASGLILSAGAGTAEASPSLTAVAHDGAARAAELLLTVEDPSLDVVLPEPHGWEQIGWLRERQRLIEVLGKDRVSSTGARRFGNTLLAVIGDRVDGLLLRPRAGLSKGRLEAKQLAAAPCPTSEETEAILSVAARRHNQPIERRLRRLGLIGDGDPERLVELLYRAYPAAASAMP